MAEVVANESLSTTPPAPEQLHFTGKAGEYFGIWIVNLLLTIVTLGIYSPWAKVRRLKYFHRHTELAGSSFDFHGNPIRILIGRLVALAMLFAYNFSVRARSPYTLVVIVLFALVLPALLRSSLRFRLYNASWRGTRFHFRGSLAGAYRVFLLNGFLTFITLYIMAPFMHQRLKDWQHNNTWFGNTRCSFHATAGQFYKVYLLLLGTLIGAIALVILTGLGHSLNEAMSAMAQAQQRHVPADPKAPVRIFLIFYAMAIVIGLSIGPVFQALIANLIWNNTRIGEHRIEARIEPLRYVWIIASNLVAMVFSLGFLTPWAAVRLLRYQMSATRLLPAGDLQGFTAAAPEDLGAVGEEATDVFDFDIAL